MKIGIVGTGYVGLVTGVCFADMGNEVTCVDIDKAKIDGLKNGVAPIYEPGLEELLKRNATLKRLRFTTDLKETVATSKIIFIAVGTPEGEDGSADLKHVLGVAGGIGAVLEDYRLIVVKSTVPVGTGEKVRERIERELEQRGVEVPFDVASNPEFLKEGSAIADFMKPDRVVIGVSSQKADGLLRELYAPFLRNNHPFISMDVRSSEMTKYAANAMLATKISFINEIANICEHVGADVLSVRAGITSDSRIGPQFLFPGIGYGGSCFPKDVKALIHTSKTSGYTARVLEAVDTVNDWQKTTLATKVLRHFDDMGFAFDQCKVALWGLAFKPNTDDVREAPSLTVIRMLLEAGVVISAYDPIASESVKRAIGEPEGLAFAENAYEALDGVNALLICTEWGEFRQPDFEQMLDKMQSPVIFDGRNIYEPHKMRELGFVYFCTGRKAG